MYVQQIYTNCLAHAAYYIESGNEAAVIDPLRDPAPYLELAKKRGATIKYVIETHFHADFVSGHIDLAEKAGASIVFGPNATPAYKAYIAEDMEMLHIGKAALQILHTPGHTIESICCLLYDEAGKMNAVFTGDTLFVGDVGRPDLMSGNLKKESLAAMLFESLRDKIKTLPASVIVYPGHGAGSACGKNIGIQSYSTIGEQLATNYALLIKDKGSFIEAVTADLPVIPGYFFKDAGINKAGYRSFDEVLSVNLRPLSVNEFISKQHPGTVVLDTREPMHFAAGFIKGAINVGLSGDFALWVGTLIAPDARILLVADPGTERQAVERLSRIGYDSVDGYLDGGMPTWSATNHQIDTVMTFSGAECEYLLETEEYFLLDVRNRLEVVKNRMSGSVHIPLNELKHKYHMLGKNKRWLVYCTGGYRSMIAASFLVSHGFSSVATIEGGIKEVIAHAPMLVDMDTDVD